MSRKPPGGTPRELGFRLPAEWEAQHAMWLTWPHNPADWPGCFEQVQQIFARVAAELTSVQRVDMLVNDRTTARQVQAAVIAAGGNADSFACHVTVTDDCWLRDCGPSFVTGTFASRSPIALIGWQFNAWGQKYSAWKNDAQVPRNLALLLDLPLFEPDIVLEGGSIDVNGCGALMTTEQCLLHSNRNPGLRRSEIEKTLHDFLGVSRIIWLGEGIAGADTGGHIDEIARFVNPTTVAAAVECNRADVNYKPLQDNLERLGLARDQNGRPLRLVTLPMPDPIVHAGRRLPGSYTNFTIANATVLVPLFNCPQDDDAMATLRELFPDRRVIGIDASELVRGGGALHCITLPQYQVQVPNT